MIVRNEAAVIKRCLDSVRDLIDSWVICDTGSTDGTQALIRDLLADIPGELHERPWVNFGHNRTELMALAAGKADYLLLIDADMTVSVEGSRPLVLRADSYMLRHAEDPQYWVKRLVLGDRRWRYVGATHEYITTDGSDEVQNLDAIMIHHHGDSGTRTEKFERDLRLLSREREQRPHDARTLFYLAQTLRDLGRIEESIDFYRRRGGMDGWDEEVFYSLYQVGVLTERMGRREEATVALLEAWNNRPQRIEPLYELAWMFRERGMHHPAYMVTRRGVDTPIPPDMLFVHRWIYEWGMLFEYSIAAYWAGHPRAALEVCTRLLRIPQLPESYRDQVIANRGYCIRAVGESTPGSVTPTGGRSGSRRRR